MKTVWYARYGEPSVLEVVDAPKPSPGPAQVLIAVHATSVNPIDWKRGTGKLRWLMPAKLPLVPGYDVAGTVAEVGPGVSGFAPGERVHARISDSRGGASAEFALAGLDVVTKMPAAMSFGDAAALPLAGMTALQGLRLAGVTAPSTARVLVVGASGGVGHFAVQLARAFGATVTGVCSGRNVELVRGLGAHAVIDYTQQDAFAGAGPFDVVLDCVGADAARWLPLLVDGGRYASTLPSPGLFARGAFNALASKKALPVLLKPNASDLAALDSLYADGKLRVVVDSRFPLERLADAWTRSMSGRAAGKIVVDVVPAS